LLNKFNKNTKVRQLKIGKVDDIRLKMIDSAYKGK